MASLRRERPAGKKLGESEEEERKRKGRGEKGGAGASTSVPKTIIVAESG